MIQLPKRPNGIPPHPAEYSVEVLEIVRQIVPSDVTVLDHMAGTGWRLAHALDDCEIVGIELEPEWASAHPCVRQGNALDLPFADGSFDWCVNSPVFGNRMSDHHDAKERCKACNGHGYVVEVNADPGARWRVDISCPKCKGAGVRSYVRMTYRHKLGRALSRDNSGQMQWGEKYRTFHIATSKEVWRVLSPGGHFVLNIKDHIRGHKVRPVTDWWVGMLNEIGFIEVERRLVDTPGMLHGQNRDARADEWVIHFVKPV